ncbi:MAG: hypothetical protein ACXWZR_03840 [Mycobacterium sp.]
MTAEDQGIANRGSTTTQALAWTAVLGGYFVAVVAVFARAATRRLPAVIMGIAATVLDVGGSAVTSFASYTGAVEWAAGY